MKIAAITDDGKTISRHFGRARYYLVLTDEEDIEAAVQSLLAGRLQDQPGRVH